MKRKKTLNCIITLLVISLLTISYLGLKKNNTLIAKDLTDYNNWTSKHTDISKNSNSLDRNSFLQKLNDNQTISILFIGDELTLGKTSDNSNFPLNSNLNNYIKNNYGIDSISQFIEDEKIDITKGIELFNSNIDVKNYDLVIISFGLNDFNEKTPLNSFAQNYSNLIGNIRTRNYKCDIISFLPPINSSEYNNKIKSICNFNNVNYIDTLEIFNDSNTELNILISNNLPTIKGYSVIESSLEKLIASECK